MSDTRQRLIDAGFELFSRNGFAAVGLDSVLRQVGVSKQTFYNHFESRDELVLHVLKYRDEWEMKVWRERLLRVAGECPRARLEALFDVLDAYFNDPEFRGCIFITAAAEFVNPADPAHQAAAAHVCALQQFIEDLATAAGASDPQFLAEQLTLLIEGAIVMRHVTGNDRAAEIARRNARILLERHLPDSANRSSAIGDAPSQTPTLH
jgi:AcrR family transcriptional regulator